MLALREGLFEWLQRDGGVTQGLGRNVIIELPSRIPPRMESKESSFSLQGEYNLLDSWFSEKKRNLDSTWTASSTAWNESSLASWYDQSSNTTPGSTWYNTTPGSTWYEKWSTSNRVSLRERIRWKKAGWIEYINDW